MTDAPIPENLAAMDLVELLDALAPIAPPPAIAMMPQTPAWWGLALLFVSGIGLLGFWALHRHRATAYRRAGLAALRQAGHDPAAIATVLRRTALAAFPRAQVARLHGADWVTFLASTAPGAGFDATTGTALSNAPYRALPPDPDLARQAAIWIRTHTNPARPKASA